MNPIVVRQTRRLVRSHTLTWTTILYLAIAVIAVSACLLLLGIRPTKEFMIQIWSTVGVAPAAFFVSIAAFCPAVMYAAARVNDELLDLAFSWHTLLYGYVLLGVLWSGYYAVLALPFVSLAFVFGGSLLPSLLNLFQNVLTGMIINLFFFSFLVKIRSMTGLVLTTIMLFFFHSMPFALLGAIEGFIAFRHMFARMSSATTSSPPLLLQNDLRFIGYVILMWLVLGIIAFLLCRSHLLQPKRVTWQVIGINLLVYGTFMILTSAIWAALRLTGLIV
ncbi:MAG: hypothetical protein LBQ50_09390 [Planctomycetaceae bacterium]|nr:hypothetical protein [Planctomycetaceae bacterium]